MKFNRIGLQTFVMKEVNRFARVYIQTLVSPWINALLYIFIFGYIVGSRISLIAGVSYIEFVLPGVLMLNVISSSFSQTSSSLYFQRFVRHIEEILVAPFSYTEMIIGYIVGGILRGVVVGLGVYAIALLFGAAQIAHPLLLLFYILSVATIFSFLGLLVGLWAENFEQLSMLNTFLITPLTFLGGVFNSINMLPPKLQIFLQWNPFFYFVDGIRYAMIGIRESNQYIGFVIIIGLIIFLSTLVTILFKKGWKIRS